MLRQSYVSTSYMDANTSLNYSFGKINGTIMADIDRNGYVDIVTFPSNYTLELGFRPLVWSNRQGVFTANPGLIKNAETFQYLRDTVQGDFDRDGYQDFIGIDQGWEINNRDPYSFKGSQLYLMKGGPNSLTHVPASQWLDTAAQKPQFNHIAATADFDADGDLDLVIGTFWNLKLLQNDGSGRFVTRQDLIPDNFGDARIEHSISGVTFIKTAGKYSIVAGTYMANATNVHDRDLLVLTQDVNNQFEIAYTITRPNLGGREQNYGAADMYNRDINADGREDLVVLWETEPRTGVDDGISNLSANSQESRYKDLTNNLATIYLQTADGKLQDTGKVYNLQGPATGYHIYFTDFNGDGYTDFWNCTYGIHPSRFNELIWINDGRGKFSNPGKIPLAETFESWYTVSPRFLDVDNDGDLDVAAIRTIFGEDYNQRNIGEQIQVFINNSKTSIDVDSVYAQTFRLYDTIFDRKPDTEGIAFWTDKIEKGEKLVDVAEQFIATQEFHDRYGYDNNEQLLKKIYKNVLDREPDPSGFSWWLHQMEINAKKIIPQVMVAFSESIEHRNMVSVELVGTSSWIDA